MNLQTVKGIWEDTCREFDIEIVEPAPLLNPDPSVMVVNAGITIFKQQMLSARPIAPKAVFQPCIRTHWKSDGLFNFTMLTAVGSMDRVVPALDAVARALTDLSLDLATLVFVLDERDEDVCDMAHRITPHPRIETQHGNSDAYWTRWTFGSGDSLVGRGLTLVAVDAKGDRCSLGNVIIVEHTDSGNSYFDIGFGLERLTALFNGGDEWAGTDWCPVLGQVCALGLSETFARDMSNHLIAAHKLIDEGAVPAAKGVGYLLRKLIRLSVDKAMTQQGDELLDASRLDTLEQVSAFLDQSPDKAAHKVVMAQANAYITAIAGGLKAARKAARRKGVDLAEIDLAGTYGLPRWATASLMRDQT